MRDRGKGGRVGGSEGTRKGRRETQCSVSGVAMHISCQWLFNSALACWREGVMAVGR